MLLKILHTKKVISILCAIAILAASLPLSTLFMPAKAASTGDIIDFEAANAADIVDGNDDFSLLGQDKEDKYYFYAKNNTADTLTLTFEDIELDVNEKYTLDFDVYTLRLSKADNNAIINLKVYGDDEISLNATVTNSDVSEENWANYHTTFVAKEKDNKLDFSLATFGKVFIDNFVLIDEDGNETALDVKTACDNTANPDHFSFETLYDIAYDDIDVIDGYLKGVVPENTDTIYNEGVNIPFNISEPIEGGRYTVTLDLKFTSLGTCRDAFCVSVAGDNYDIIQQKWINAVDITLNKYETFSFDFDLLPEHNKFRFNVYQGCTAYIDNVILTDAAGTEIVKIDFDSAVNFEGAAFEQKGIPKAKSAVYSRLLAKTSDRDYVVLVDNSKGTNFGQLYLHEVGMPYDNVYPIGDYTIKFDFYALEIGSNRNIVAQLTKPDWSGDAFPGSGQKWLEISETLNEWQTVSFDITTVAEGRFPWFYIGAGIKGYFDNFQIIPKNSSAPSLKFSPTVADLGKKSKEICKVVEYPKTEDNSATDNYAILIDNSKGTNFGQLYLHEVGMAYDTIYPVRKYTIKFDFYALEIGSNKNIVAHLTAPGWSGDAFPGTSGQKWLEIEEKIGEWQTVSFDVTTVSDGQFPWFYIGAGIKGYFDNFRIITDLGTTLLDFSPTAADLGKTSKEICTVVKLPSTEGGSGESTDGNKVMLIDTTTVADNGSDNRNFWFNLLGMEGYYNKLASGKKYTITFDVYPLQKPVNQGGFFHYRTSSGSDSVNAGWWGSDLQLDKWQTTSNTFTVSDASKTGNHVLYVYGGFKGYIDNLKLVDENGNTVEGTFTDFEELTVPNNYKDYLEITTLVTEEEPEKSGDFGVLIDNSKVTSFGQLYLHEVGMPYDTVYPVGNYTIKFKFYALEIGSNKNIVVCMSKPDWSGNAFPGSEGQKWLEIENKIGEWQELSFDITTIAEGRFPNFHIGAGIKGYFDDFKIIKKGTSTPMLDFSPVEADLGKTSKTINTVVELPVDVANAKNGGGSTEPDEPTTSGMKITVLRGRAGKDGASIMLGGANSPLTLKSNTSYRLSFKYYQANPTNSGVLNLFGIDAGFDNDIAYFKKNNTIGWANGTVYFTTGEVTDTSADWLKIILNANAWVYFDDFKLVEQEKDNNKQVNVIDFKTKDDSIYPTSKVEDCEFGHSSEMGGTFKVVNATEYTNKDKNSNRQYTFSGIKMKSNTTYRVSIDYYVSNPFTDYAAAFGYEQSNLGLGTGSAWPCFINNKTARGWHTASFTVTTGDVVPNANYINLAFYDVNDSSEPRIMHFDNLTFTELYKISTSTNDSTLGTITRTFTVEGGDNAKVVANAYEGVTFEGWYEYGDLVSKDKIYRLTNVNDNHNLVARFSGEAIKSTHIIQGFEDYDLGAIDFEWYEVVNDKKNVLEGKQSLHVKGDKIMESIEASIFFPLVSNVEAQLKDDYTYDVYVWIKPTVEAESQTYFALVHSESRDLSDMLYSGQLAGSGLSSNIKPHSSSALESKNGWLRYQIGTITKRFATMDGFAFQICKFHANRMEGASIDDFYVDRVEVVERTPDFANLKYTEKLFNEIANSDFEEKVTEENWAPLTNGLTIEKVTKAEHDWQGKHLMKFDAAKSNGEEYVRVIPIGKPGKNYTFAAWTKLSKGSDITVGLYSNGRYSKFENIVNGKNGTLPMKDDGKWNRVSFTFNTGDSDEAYIVIKGTKGTLLLDMVELFIAERGFKVDPNMYSNPSGTLEIVDPLAFPDKIETETVTVENPEDDETEVEEEDEQSESKKKTKKKRVVVVRKVGGISVWLWVGIGAGALAVIAAAIVTIIVIKRKKSNKEAK